jgi:chromosome segregation ATPase
MDKNVSKLQNKIKEIDELVEKFDSQSKQLDGSKDELQKATRTIEGKFEEQIQSVYAARKALTDSLEEVKKTCEKLTGRENATVERYDMFIGGIQSTTYTFSTLSDSIKNALAKENFKELCDKLSELARVLEECKSLRDDLINLKASITNEISQKVEAEIESIRTQQADDRAFMESKFAELFKIFESQTAQETEQ